MDSLRLCIGSIFVLSALLIACGSDQIDDGVTGASETTAIAESGAEAEAPTETTEVASSEVLEVDPAETDQTLEIADAFMAARNEHDADALLALLNPDVVVHDFGRWPRTYDEYPALLEWFVIFNWQWDLQECVEVNSGPPVRILCTHLMENDWARAQQADPVPGQIELVIEDGLIIEVDSDTGEWVPKVYVPWFEWLVAEHEEDIPVLFRFDDANNLTGGPATDPEALELYRQYRVEYIEYAESFETPETE